VCDAACDEDCDGASHGAGESPIVAWLLPWQALSPQSRAAALLLGYNKTQWNTEENAVGGSQRYEMDCLYSSTSRIRQVENGNWHTQAYLDFSMDRSTHPEKSWDDFCEQYDDFVDARWRSRLECTMNHTWGGVCHCGRKIAKLSE